MSPQGGQRLPSCVPPTALSDSVAAADPAASTTLRACDGAGRQRTRLRRDAMKYDKAAVSPSMAPAIAAQRLHPVRPRHGGHGCGLMRRDTEMAPCPRREAREEQLVRGRFHAKVVEPSVSDDVAPTSHCHEQMRQRRDAPWRVQRPVGIADLSERHDARSWTIPFIPPIVHPRLRPASGTDCGTTSTRPRSSKNSCDSQSRFPSSRSPVGSERRWSYRSSSQLSSRIRHPVSHQALRGGSTFVPTRKPGSTSLRYAVICGTALRT